MWSCGCGEGRGMREADEGSEMREAECGEMRPRHSPATCIPLGISVQRDDVRIEPLDHRRPAQALRIVAEVAGDDR